MNHVRSIVASLILMLLATSCATVQPRDLQSFETRAADIYIVPIGPIAPEYLVSLGSYYEDVFGLKVGITPPLPYLPRVYDSKRQQLITQNLISLMQLTFEGYSSNREAVFIGITHSDMYIEGKSWRFAYAQRIGWHFAVVSSSRTTREPQAEFSEIKEVHPGLRKMVTKTVGLLYYKKSLNSNPESVLYDRVLGLDDLEQIDESTLYSDILGR